MKCMYDEVWAMRYVFDKVWAMKCVYDKVWAMKYLTFTHQEAKQVNIDYFFVGDYW